MDNYKIAILITTFLRDALLYKTIQSIIENLPIDSMVLIADQGYKSDDKTIAIDYYQSQIPLNYYQIPFDSGLSVARNFLVQKASEINIPYCLVMYNSIQFTGINDFEPLFCQLDRNTLINFQIKETSPAALKHIFIAKTDTLINLWDSEMKLYEYSLASLKYIKCGYRISWNKNYNFKRVGGQTSEEYKIYRKRIKNYQILSGQKVRGKCI
jgi:glycosyltransferase involved in cell wall biosynthesis